MFNKEKLVNGLLISIIIIFTVGLLGYLFWIDFESPKYNNKLAEEICSNKISVATGIRENGQYGMFAYVCGLEVGKEYILYINNSNSKFRPLEFQAENSFKTYRIGFDKYSPEADWFIYLYSESEQIYLAEGVYHFEGGRMIVIVGSLWEAIFPLMLLLVIIFGFWLLFETFVLKRKILRRLFEFEPEKDSEIFGINATIQDSNTVANLDQLSNKSEKKEEK